MDRKTFDKIMNVVHESMNDFEAAQVEHLFRRYLEEE